jgi:hypothetical protein
MNVLPHARATGNIHIGTMAGKLNAVMPATTKRLTKGFAVDVRADVLSYFAVEKERRRRRELDDLHPALDLAVRVGEDIPVLRGDRRGDLVDPALEDP